MGWANEGFDENNEVVQIFGNPVASAANRRWKKPGDVTDVPRASLMNRSHLETNSAFVEDGSFWRIRTINIGYTVRPEKTRYFNQARFFAQVQNPFVFTNYSWFDPEVSTNGGTQDKTAGADYATYPQARTFSIGVNATF
jgi:hypothetical protein